MNAQYKTVIQVLSGAEIKKFVSENMEEAQRIHSLIGKTIANVQEENKEQALDGLLDKLALAGLSKEEIIAHLSQTPQARSAAKRTTKAAVYEYRDEKGSVVYLHRVVSGAPKRDSQLAKYAKAQGCKLGDLIKFYTDLDVQERFEEKVIDKKEMERLMKLETSVAPSEAA